MKSDALAREMRGLRDHVAGITDTMVAAVDGMLIAADMADNMDPEGLAALAAAGLGVARRTVGAAGRGELRRIMTYGSHGCTAVYAIRDIALMVVLGDEGLNTEHLHRESRAAVDRIGSILLGSAP
jgi:predicted regulator of Ras-like GTPase activity (Roadblock/LC7/MglB family)